MSERVSNEQALADSRIGRGKGRPFKFNDDRPGLRAYALDLLDARRERDEARPVLEAVRRLNAARFADWTDYHLEDSLGWALKWGPAEWEAEVSAVIAIRAVAAARAAAKEVG